MPEPGRAPRRSHRESEFQRPRLSGPLIAVTALALVARAFRLGHQSYWVDEIASIQAGLTKLSMMKGWYFIDPHPPLFYTLMKSWLLFGQNEWWLRLFPALCGTATVSFTYLAGRRLLGQRVALAGAVLLAVNPLSVWLGQELRSMALLGLLATVSVWLLVRAIDTGMRRYHWWFVAVTALMLYTHYYAVFVLAFEFALVVWTANRARGGPVWLLGAIALPALLFVPWLWVLKIQLSHHGQVFRQHDSLARVAVDLYTYFTAFHSPWRPETFVPAIEEWYRADRAKYHLAVLGLLAPFGAMALLGLWKSVTLRRDDSKFVDPRLAGQIVAGWFLVPVLLVALVTRFVPAFEPKYLVAALPAWCLLVAAGLVWTWRKTRILAVILGAWIAAVTGIGLFHHYFDPAYHKPDWNGFVTAKTGELTTEDIWLIYDPTTVSDGLYYLEREKPGARVVRILSRGEVVEVLDDEQRIERVLSRYRDVRSIWFLHGQGFLHDPDGIAPRVLAENGSQIDEYPVQDGIGYVMKRYRIHGPAEP